MWHSYRQCLLHLTDLLCRIKLALSEEAGGNTSRKDFIKLTKDMESSIEEVCASIPFMLMGENMTSSAPNGAIWFHARPPMLMGGLSLQWIFFTITTLHNVCATTKHMMRSMLLWLARNLGIGQAEVLANVSDP